jgi:hypothetical protein
LSRSPAVLMTSTVSFIESKAVVNSALIPTICG